MRWAALYVGIPFVDHGREGGADCWGLVRAVLADVRGVMLPDYGNGYAGTADHEGIEASIREGLVRDFQRVEVPQAFDLVIFNLCNQPRHVGLMVTSWQFLHVPEGQSSRIERIEDRMWAKRVEGFYRHVG
jgi:cell wall-associated NlpC family hydrolase